MTYDVRLSRDAARYLERLRPDDQRRMVRRLEQVAADPAGSYSKPLTNAPGFRSARVGEWRILFVINDEERAIEVTDIGPRGQVYRRL
jgi:mRNA interferase RelE/StbE